MTRPNCPKCGGKMQKTTKTPGGKQRWRCASSKGGKLAICYQTTQPDQPPRKQGGQRVEPDSNPQFKRPLGGTRLAVVTWAQNATPVHDGVFAALRTYCEARGAELIVITGRYKNPTSRWSESQENQERWAPEVESYLYNQRKKLNDSLVLVGDLKIQPTAVSPLTALEGLTAGESSIIGHPKAQMKCVATPQNALLKVLRTTGAVTVPNHSDSRAGKMGDFHHHLGALVVEIQGSKVFHMRRISCRKDGAFIDLDRAYYPDGTVEDAPPYEALVFGDAHYRFADKGCVRATFEPGGLVDTLNPKRLVWHDLLDGYAISPHHVGNPMIAIAKQRAGFHLAEKEVRETVDFLVRNTGDRESFVVASNHDDMLSRWIMREDWKTDPENAEFYLETALHMARSAKMGDGGSEYIDPFQFWVQRLVPSEVSVRCLRRNEPLSVKGTELSMHGDAGPSGARGSIKNLSRLGTKVMSGHGHSPAEEEGHTRVGTMSRLDLEYVRGPGAWMHAHGGIDAFGKRHLFLIVDGKFRVEDKA